MTTYRTGNPIGSTDPKDLYDNAENTDVWVNSLEREYWDDRFGRNRKTIYGMEQDFQQFLIDSGYVNIGDYIAGLEITERNQIFWKDGELYRAGASLELPYITTGDWETEGSLFKAVGDQALRQELSQQGALDFNINNMYDPHSIGGAVVFRVRSIDALRNTRGRFANDTVFLIGYYEDTPGMGSGTFIWNDTSDEIDNGGTVISAGGVGRWERQLVNPFVTSHEFGCRPAVGKFSEEDFDIKDNIEAAVATGMDVFFNPGKYLYSGEGIKLLRGQKVFGKRHGRQSLSYDSSTQIESTLPETPLFTFDFRIAEGSALYGVSGPSVENLRMVSDYPVLFGDRTQDIQNDRHIAPIMLGRIAGNYMQPLTAGVGYGICLVKCFDYVIEDNEIFDTSVGVYLIGSDINKIRNNRVVRSHGAHIRVFSTGTFGSQNEISGNDILTAGSVGCTYIQTNDRHTRIYDNYLEEAYGPCSGFIDMSPEAVPSAVGPNERSTILSIICRDNRIDGHVFAENFIYRINPNNATIIDLRDTNTTGVPASSSTSFNIIGGYLRGTVGGGNAPTSYSILGAIFGRYDGYVSSTPKLTPSSLVVDCQVTKALQMPILQTSEARIRHDSFVLPYGVTSGSSMVLLPFGRSGREDRTWIRPGGSYTIAVRASSSSTEGVPVTVGLYHSGGQVGAVTAQVGNNDTLITTTFTAPNSGTDFGVMVTKGTGSDNTAVYIKSIAVNRD